MFADIIVDISVESLDQSFQYSIPEEWEESAQIGVCVLIPFGRGNRIIQGFIIGISDQAKIPMDKIKPIHSVETGKVVIEAQLLQLAAWIHKRYGGAMNEALKTVLPVKKQVKKKKSRKPEDQEEWKEAEIQSLNETQQSICDSFSGEYMSGIRSVSLIHGVTGSGKTEVYMQMAEQVLQTGKKAIVLVPEIALTHQTVMRFRRKFGGRVSVLHSRMSSGERYDQYKKALNDEIDIVIGPRSVLFLPLSDLGIIVIDEEHETSYKNESTPKYHAREVAIQRAKTSNASVVLVSATPSLETYTKAKTGEYHYYEMNERIGEAVLPQIHIVDLRREFAMKNHSVFSKLLQNLIWKKLERKEQIMLFLNRRGFSGFVSCRKCGEVLTCVHCDVSYKAHKGKGGRVDSLVCHYCGHSIPMPECCPECGSEHIAGFGMGTEQLEQITKQMFPAARILRMDADTTSAKGAHEEVLGKFRRGDADILIGTQMIVKGHDFPSVTLVGVIAADLSMYTGDYQSSERTFQLLMQASGRAGRGQLAGEVVIQTYQPEHHCVTAVKEQNYEMFYTKEMAYRKALRYPPAYCMMVILFMSRQEEESKRIAEQLAEEARSYGIQNVTVIGPAKANLSKISDWYRYTLYIKCNEEEGLFTVKDKLEDVIEDRLYKKTCGIQFDMNPISSY